MHKECIDCHITTDQYYRKYDKRCKSCTLVKRKEYYQNNKEQILKSNKERYELNSESLKEKQRDYYWNNRKQVRDYQKSYYESNKETFSKKNKDYRQKNREELLVKNRVASKVHYLNNKEYYTAKVAKRRATKINATPSWLTDDHLKQIEQVYEHARDCTISTGEQYHVDHIVPLNNPEVCGLHVPWNLQVLPADVNLSKGNKF